MRDITRQPPPVDERVPYPPDAELALLFPVVDEFAVLMRREMWANRRKGERPEWQAITLVSAWEEVQWHSAKLAMAVRYPEPDGDSIRQFAADVANQAMILADAAGVLGD